MNYERAKEILTEHKQAHLLDYYDELDGDARKLLLSDIEKLDFSVLKNIGRTSASKYGEIRPIPAVTLNDVALKKDGYEKEGLKLLKSRKVAAVLLAGGQGTRLGFDKPKGMFDVGVTESRSIFSLLIDNAISVAKRAGVYFPLFIMTSTKNNADTVNFFKQNAYFGYPEEEIHFFIQNTEPACSFDGKIFLDEKYKISQSPNGNGGWYSSLKSSGLDRILKENKIEWINVFGVDNVLQKICDPAFIGATALSGCNCASKVVKKTCAEEKVGVLCEEDGKPSIIEYYEMPKSLLELRGSDGELAYRYGVILNYLFSVEKLNDITHCELPYHLAEKAIPHIAYGKKVNPGKPNGYKFETLVVDMVRLMDSCLAYEVEREKEFAPVKNKEGVDSAFTARELLRKNGYVI